MPKLRRDAQDVVRDVDGAIGRAEVPGLVGARIDRVLAGRRAGRTVARVIGPDGSEGGGNAEDVAGEVDHAVAGNVVEVPGVGRVAMAAEVGVGAGLLTVGAGVGVGVGDEGVGAVDENFLAVGEAVIVAVGVGGVRAEAALGRVGEAVGVAIDEAAQGRAGRDRQAADDDVGAA